MGPEVVAAASIGSLALEAGGSIIKGHGESAAQEYQAQKDKRAAEIGRIKASQTDAHLRDELATTLANIDVIRAAGNTDPLSPTALALKAKETEVSDRNRTTAVGSLLQQAAEDDAAAAFRKKSAKWALFGGYAGAAAKIGKGVAKAG